MLHLIENLQFKASVEFVSEKSPCFKALEYPPADYFALSIDKDQNVISKYGDDIWDFTAFGLNAKINFKNLDPENRQLFKQLIYYITYSHLFPKTYNSLFQWYMSFKDVFATCSRHNIKASDLSRYPRLIDEIAINYAKKSPSLFRNSVYHFDLVLNNQEQLGFKILDNKSIAIYKGHDPSHQNNQTAYIPNRIWTKFILNLDSILNEFKAHSEKIESLYHYLVKTTLLNKENGISAKYSSPFNNHSAKGKILYGGTLEDYLNANGLMDFFEKYLERPATERFPEYTTDQFGALINNVVISCYLYIIFYSIMRKEEALSLKTNCLQTENDNRIGTIYLLIGETTKTDPDSDARWVVPQRVEKAVKIAEMLVGWKLQYIKSTDKKTPLIQNLKIWNTVCRSVRPRMLGNFNQVINKKAPYFFKINEYQITQEDYDEATAITPSLVNQKWFKVGGIWQFGFHQFRRTLAVHFALNKVSSSSTQLQMKHATRKQQFYYQNNSGRLRLNHLAEQEVANEYYAEMSRNIASVVHGEMILPHEKSPVSKDIVRFITNGEKGKLQKAMKNGLVGYRKNILGGCMKQGVCEFGGFDSIAHCAGGDGGKPCSDLIIDGLKEQEFKEDKLEYIKQLDDVPNNSPRFSSLQAEIRGYETILNIIEKKKG